RRDHAQTISQNAIAYRPGAIELKSSAWYQARWRRRASVSAAFCSEHREAGQARRKYSDHRARPSVDRLNGRRFGTKLQRLDWRPPIRGCKVNDDDQG